MHFRTGTSYAYDNDNYPERFLVRDVGVNLNDVLAAGPVWPSSLHYTTRVGGGTSVHEIWHDFGDGAVYAEGHFTPDYAGTYKTYSYALTAQGIADINAAAGTVMGMGFQPTSGPFETFWSNAMRLTLNRFNDPVSSGGGIDFQLDDGDVAGGGTVDVTPLGVKHRLNSIATGQQTTDSDFSEVRRRFRFDSAGGHTQVVLTGDLDGLLEANEGRASVDATIKLYDTTDGSLIDDDAFQQTLAPIGPGYNQLFVDEQLRVDVDLVPGRTYEIISRVELTTSVTDPLGQAAAWFDNTFDVQLTGVPEPGTLSLLALGGLVALRRRRACC